MSAVTQLSHALGMSVIAEGVETWEQRDRLVDLGCEMAQGFLYARPLSSAELSTALQARDGELLVLP